MSLICQNCGYERKPHEIGLPEDQDPNRIIPGYKLSLSSCIKNFSFNPDPREVRRIERLKEAHLR
jgi:hypothetical protein